MTRSAVPGSAVPGSGDGALVVGFTSLEESEPEDWALLLGRRRELYEGLAGRVFRLLESMSDDSFGWPISRKQHCLQAATRALRDGATDEMVVVALLHDVFDEICPGRHAEPAAAMLKPFLTPRAHWVLAHHTRFQLAHHDVGWRRYSRYALIWHPHYRAAARFSALWDTPSFDPAYDTLPVSAFEPVVARVLDPAALSSA